MRAIGTGGIARKASSTLTPGQRRSMVAACLAHALHDGYTDLLYSLLPVWQTQFGLSYAGLAAVRALYYGTMSGLQIPGVRMIKRFGGRPALVLSTLVAAMGFLTMALPFGFPGLCVGLVLAGIGSSIQHPRASLLVTDAFGERARGPLGIYNFAGDLGKATLPALTALLLPVLPWRPIVGLMGMLGAAIALALLGLVPNRQPSIDAPILERPPRGNGRLGFEILMVIGALDSATRMGYLLFLPFLIQSLGGTSATIGIGLALVFVGGALGKAACGWLGQRLGVIGSVILTEAATALLIAATLFMPLVPMLAALPLLGIALNGTSSVLYGTVPELAPKGDVGRAFAFFYTCGSAFSGLAPIVYGAVADHFGQGVGIWATACTSALIVPLALALRPALSGEPAP